jgi:hypothetical protein
MTKKFWRFAMNRSKPWKHGLQRLSPGIYAHPRDHSLHIDAAELLEANGYAPTEENQKVLHEAAAAIARRTGARLHELEI